MKRILSLVSFVLLPLFFTLSCSDDDDGVTAPDHTPHATLTSPINDAHVSDLISLEATATDDKGIALVQFYLDGSLVASDAVPPYKYLLNIEWLPHNSVHSIYAVGLDTDGNRGGSVPILVTVDTTVAAPAPVTLAAPVVNSSSSMTLTWTRNADVDFSAYRLRYDTASSGPVTGGEKIITDQNDTTWTAAGLLDTTAYRFVVQVVDQKGHESASNEVVATTPNAPPPPIASINAERKPDRVTFSWVTISVPDFAAYKVVRSTDSTYDGADEVLATITDQAVSTYDYMTVDQTAYVYFMVTRDQSGLETASSPVTESTIQFGHALEFDGTAYCTVPYFSALDLGDTYTLEAWINQTTSTLTYMRVIDKSPTGSPYLQYSLISDAHLGADFCANGAPARVHASAGVTLNEWHHVALTYNSGTIIYYIDGAPVDTTFTTVSTSCSFETTLNIGRRELFDEFYFRGAIDEVRVWNVVRTPAEIASVYDYHLNGNESGLVCYYDFDEGAGDVITSPIGGNGYLGSAAGSDAADPVWVVSGAPIRY